MADPKQSMEFIPYPGPSVLSTLTIGAATNPVQFSVFRWPDSPTDRRLRLYCEAGAFVLSPSCTEADLVALRDMLNTVIADAPAAAIPVGEATDSDHAALDAIGSAA